MELVPAQQQLPQVQQQQPETDGLIRMAKAFALSEYFDDLRGDTNKKIAQAFTKIATGQEFGVPPSAAIRGIHILKGRPTISAGLMSGLVKRSGKYDYRVIERSGKRCEIACFERINGQLESLGPNIVWDIEKAKTAGLSGKDIWKKYPDRLLFARAISEACTIYFPDLLLGNVYTPEELDYTEDAEYVDVQPEATQEATQEAPKQLAEVAPEEIDYDAKIKALHTWLEGEATGGPEAIIEAQKKARANVNRYPDAERERALALIESFSPDAVEGDPSEFAETPEFFQEPAR